MIKNTAYCFLLSCFIAPDENTKFGAKNKSINPETIDSNLLNYLDVMGKLYSFYF